MTGFVLVRAIFVATVAYTSWVIGPIAESPLASAALGACIALVIVAAEARLRDAAVTSLLGGLLGFGIGLWLANTIVGALTWSNTSDTKVQFLHGLIVVVLPFMGMMLGARRGEWLEPAKLVSLFKDARPQKRYKILDTSVIIDGRVAEVV